MTKEQFNYEKKAHGLTNARIAKVLGIATNSVDCWFRPDRTPVAYVAYLDWGKIRKEYDKILDK